MGRWSGVSDCVGCLDGGLAPQCRAEDEEEQHEAGRNQHVAKAGHACDGRGRGLAEDGEHAVHGHHCRGESHSDLSPERGQEIAALRDALQEPLLTITAAAGHGARRRARGTPTES